MVPSTGWCGDRVSAHDRVSARGLPGAHYMSGHEHHFGSDPVTAAFRETGSPRRDLGEGSSSSFLGFI